MTVVVRTPRLTDADELARINIDTWRDAYAGIVPQTALDAMDLAAHRERWVRNLAEERPSLVVAEVDGALAAYATGGAYRPQPGAEPEDTRDVGEVYALYVDPPKQGRGAGVAVHAAVLAGLRAEGYGAAVLWVLEANVKSRSWYAARGWRPDGATGVWTSAGQALPEVRLRIASTTR